MVLPIAEEVGHVPQRKLVNFNERPSGSSRDVTVDKRPLRYTGTGVGSPGAAFLSPETSSTALNKA